MPEENKPYLTTRYSWFQRHGTLAIILALIFFAVVIGLSFTSQGFSWERVFGVSTIFLILGFALFDNLVEMLNKQQFWCTLAERTGLTCQTGSFWLGYPVQVMGQYHQRALVLHTHKRGKGQVPLTRIEVQVSNLTHASLRLRGPFNRSEAITDKVANNLFSASDARQFGDDQRFFIRSQPVHLVTTMFKAGPLRTNLLQLKPLSSIELEDQKLTFEQIGIVKDIDYLQFVFDLLSDLADTIEHGGFIKLSSTPDKVR